MSEADQLLRLILETGDIIGRDAAGRTIIQLAIEDAALDELLSFGAEAAESEDGGDDEPYAVPPVHTCWFEDCSGSCLSPLTGASSRHVTLR